MRQVDELQIMQRTDRCYRSLIGADIYRDGGSLMARFVLADGQFETLWLRAAADSSHDQQILYSVLLYPDVERNAPATQIESASPEEKSILDAIETFLANPDVSVPFSRNIPAEDYLDILRELAQAIPGRTNQAEPTVLLRKR